MTNRFIVVAIALALSGALVLAQTARSPEALFKAAQHTEEVQGDLKAAIEQYKKVIAAGNRSLAAEALLRIAECHQKLGDAESRKIYEQLIRDFADQTDAVTTARTRLAALAMPAGTTAKVIWSEQGIGTDGVSADGRWLTFQQGDTGDLALRDLATGTNRLLTNTGGWIASGDYVDASIISADGQQVAYAWFIEEENRYELRVIGTAGGSAPRTLMRIDKGEYVTPWAWTPDRRGLVVLKWSADRSKQIGIVSIRDGSYRGVKSLEWREPQKVSLSPDGRYIAYDVPAADNGSPHDIRVLATDGSRETTIVQGPANDVSPIWTPDGSRVLFLTDRTGSVSLWSVPVLSGTAQEPPTSVRNDIGRVGLVGMTRSGALYYMIRGSARSNVYVADIDASGTVRRPTLGTETFLNSNFGPVWSRDGHDLAFFSTRDHTVLVVRNTASGAEHVVDVPRSVQTFPQSGPKWFPDGQAVLVQARSPQGNGFEFDRVSIDTGKADVVWRFNGRSACGSFDLSPEGKSIYCARGEPEPSTTLNNSSDLVRYDIDSRQETLLKKGEWFITLAVSPDGNQLAYLKSVRENHSEAPGVIEIIPTAGGPSREVYRYPNWYDGSRYNTLAWMPDQRSLLFVRPENGVQILWRVPTAGGSPEQTGLMGRAVFKSPSVHPDGKRIAYGAREIDNNELWALENFLPAASKQ